MPQKSNRKKSSKKTSKQNKPESDENQTKQSIDKLPGKVVEKIIRPTVMEVTKEVCELSIGPLPPPQILEGYENICPGFADRIVRMAEVEGEHRRKMNEKALNADIEINNTSLRIEGREIFTGQILAFCIATIITLCGSYVALKGFQVSGTIISSTGAVGLVTAFIVGRTGTQNNKTKKDDNSDDKKITD